VAIVIAQAINHFGVLARPEFEAAKLLGPRNALIAGRDINRRLEVIGNGEDKVNRAGRNGSKSMPRGRRQSLSRVNEFFLQAHPQPTS
jgi:hypothetical protein